MKTIYSKFDMDAVPTKTEKFFFWLLLALGALSAVTIAVAYVYSLVSGDSGNNIPFV